MVIIDLSQEIFPSMPVFDGHPQVEMRIAVAHEEQIVHNEPQDTDTPTTALPFSAAPSVAPSAHEITLSEHVGTHVDAFNHFSPKLREQGIDTMPLSMFITSGFCLDFSHKGLLELIELDEIEAAIAESGLQLQPNDTLLLYTDHYRRCYGTDDWPNGAGISEEVAIWFGEQKIAAFGVETRSPGVRKISNRAVHRICGEMGYTHYENLINLEQLVGVGRFQFIGLPLKIRGGTGSPVRAVAILA